MDANSGGRLWRSMGWRQVRRKELRKSAWGIRKWREPPVDEDEDDDESFLIWPLRKYRTDLRRSIAADNISVDKRSSIGGKACLEHESIIDSCRCTSIGGKSFRDFRS